MNLQGKLSGLKGLVSHSHSKRRFKGDLTLDMISPPLGDFRHTMHVGRGGDVFGDTSFLSNHGGKKKDNGNAGGDTDSNSTTPDNKIGAFFSRTLRQVRKGSTSESRPGSAAKEQLSLPPPPVSPIVKNAISLPRLDVDVANGSPTTKVLFPKSPGSPEEETKYSYGLESGFVTLPRLSRAERQQPSISRSQNVHRGSLTDATDAILSSCPVPTLTSDPDVVTAAAPVTPPPTTRSDSLPSLTSLDFTFDLGPSLMSEVFGLIDSPYGHSEGPGGHAWEGEEAGSACGLTNEGSEMDSATISYVDSLQREDCGGGKSPCGGEWGEEEEGRPAEGVPLKGTVPDVAMVGSPGRERVGLESDKFQSAADALARHYSGSSGGGQGQADAGDSEAPVVDETRKKTSYSYDEEEEIKV